MNTNLKDWQIAQIMFGKNTNKECKLVSNIRKHYKVESLCDNWSVIYDSSILDDCGWLISNECL